MTPKPKSNLQPKQALPNIGAMPESVLSKMRRFEDALRASKVPKDELIRMCAGLLFASEELSAQLAIARAHEGRSAGTVSILDALAASADDGYDMSQTVELALRDLNPRHESLLSLMRVLDATSRDSRSKTASAAATVGHARSKKRQAKDFVRDCWLTTHGQYPSDAAFARDMMEKQPELQSEVTIARWVREWRNASKPEA